MQQYPEDMSRGYDSDPQSGMGMPFTHGENSARVIYCKSKIIRLNPLGFSPLWVEPSSGHIWESQVLLMDGQVVFLRVLRFSPTFDEPSARYK